MENKSEGREKFYFLDYLQKLLDLKEKRGMMVNPEKARQSILDLNFFRVIV